MNKVKISLIVYCGSLLALSCGGGENNPIKKAKNAMNQVSETVDVMKSESNSQSTIQDSMSRIEELKNITPASKEEFKTWLPENIEGYKRKSYSAGDPSLGAVSAISASYSSESGENKTFDLNVVDGAGESGGVFAIVYLAQFNCDFEEEHADGFSYFMEKNNKKAIVSQNDHYNTSEVEYLEGQRYYVQMSGNNMNLDELWEIAYKFRTQNLPGL